MVRAVGATGVGVVVGVSATGGKAGHITMTLAPMIRAGAAAALAPPADAQGGRAIQGLMTPARMAAVVRDAAALALLGCAVGRGGSAFACNLRLGFLGGVIDVDDGRLIRLHDSRGDPRSAMATRDEWFRRYQLTADGGGFL